MFLHKLNKGTEIPGTYCILYFSLKQAAGLRGCFYLFFSVAAMRYPSSAVHGNITLTQVCLVDKEGHMHYIHSQPHPAHHICHDQKQTCSLKSDNVPDTQKTSLYEGLRLSFLPTVLSTGLVLVTSRVWY